MIFRGQWLIDRNDDIGTIQTTRKQRLLVETKFQEIFSFFELKQMFSFQSPWLWPLIDQNYLAELLIGQHLPNCALVLRVHGFAEGAVEVGGELWHVGERASDAEA
jgi:hypothetical protein